MRTDDHTYPEDRESYGEDIEVRACHCCTREFTVTANDPCDLCDYCLAAWRNEQRSQQVTRDDEETEHKF